MRVEMYNASITDPRKSPAMRVWNGCGWNFFIYAKKFLFVRTIATQEENKIYANVFSSRLRQFNDDIQKCVRNEFSSPVFDILRISIIYGLYEEVCEW